MSHLVAPAHPRTPSSVSRHTQSSASHRASFNKILRAALRMGLALVLAIAGPVAAAGFTPGVLGKAAAQGVIDHGHVDAFNVTAEGGNLRLDLKEDVTGQHVRRAPESVVLKIKQQAYTDKVKSVKGVGEAGYYLPITQDPNLVWPGWDTQALAGTPFSGVNIVFDQVAGPGNVYLFSTSGFGEVQSLLNNGSTRVTNGVAIPQTRPAHTHANWVFSQPGTYKMRVYAQGKDSNGNVNKSNVATYTWSVGDGSAPKSSNKSGAAGTAASNSASGANSAAGVSGKSGASGTGTGALGANGGTSASGLSGTGASGASGALASGDVGTLGGSNIEELPGLSADGGTGAVPAGSGQLANTGVEPTTVALVTLGLGLTVFGVGWVLLNRGALQATGGGASRRGRNSRSSQK